MNHQNLLLQDALFAPVPPVAQAAVAFVEQSALDELHNSAFAIVSTTLYHAASECLTPLYAKPVLADLTDAQKAAPELLAALREVVMLAKEMREHWDADRDMKVGKYLLALSGFLPGYDKRTDEIHATILAAGSQA